jgi:MFS family permease
LSEPATISSPPSWLRRFFGAATLDLTPLRVSRDYRLLFIGQFVSAFGYAITYVALPWQVYRLTKSTLLVGLLGLTEFGPMLLLAFVGGALADSVDRRRLIIWAEAGLALSCAALIANALLPEPRIWVLFAAAALTAGSNALHRPALESLTPQLLPAEHMPAVAALSSFRFSFTFIIGPAIAGVIAETFGAATAYGIDLATYAVSIVTLLLIRSIPAVSALPRPSLSSVAEGLRYARGRPELLGTYLIDMNAMFFGMPIALFPAIAASFGGASVGLFYSMLAVGPLAVTLTSGWTNRIHRHGLGVTWAVVVWGLAIVGFGLATNLWLALAFLVLAGAADCVSGLFRMTMWNQTIPDRYRGRLAGIEMVSYTSGPYLGNAEAGLVASAFGLRTSVVSGGILCVLGAGVLAVLLPKFLRYDAREGLARKRADDDANSAATAATSPSS